MIVCPFFNKNDPIQALPPLLDQGSETPTLAVLSTYRVLSTNVCSIIKQTQAVLST